MLEVRPAEGAGDIATIETLFRAYAAALDFGLDFQGFDRELAGLPGDYAPPGGCLLLAEDGAIALGCVAMRPLEPPAVCEMKRLYVAPAGRGRGVGRALAERLLQEARGRGYARMRLDTVPGMEAAIALYRSLGFHEIPAYRFNPIPGALYLEADL